MEREENWEAYFKQNKTKNISISKYIALFCTILKCKNFILLHVCAHTHVLYIRVLVRAMVHGACVETRGLSSHLQLDSKD